jgi:hypothetical protein
MGETIHRSFSAFLSFLYFLKMDWFSEDICLKQSNCFFQNHQPTQGFGIFDWLWYHQ